MSSTQRETVFCHQCENEWFRSEFGLTCPRCHSDFVEVIEENNNPRDFLHRVSDDDEDDEPLNPWAPVGGGVLPGPLGSFGQPGFPFSNLPSQPANRPGPGFSYSERRTPGGGMVITSFSYSSRGAPSPADTHAQVMQNFSGMIQGLLGNIHASRGFAAGSPLGSSSGSPSLAQPRNQNDPDAPQQVVDPLASIMSQFFPLQTGHRSPPPPGAQDDFQPNPFMGLMRLILSGHPTLHVYGHGDAAYSQEEFDRIMSQLLEQAQQGGGVPPASEQEIARLPKIRVDQDWLDGQEHKECTICLNEAKLGEDINELWCGHWYHPDCIKMWLDAHDQCPLCRKPLQQSREEYEARQSKTSKRRHSSRTHSQNNGQSSRDDGSSSSNGNQDSAGGSGLRDRITSLFRGSSR
ncbi:uncharacterized protein PV09_00750 [Verruconis gallopava]|uniref:RING-type E3 ubiquitin transferase n=1 Tax=Verruconis gallopava TaxID=253628 RepID=A0A0D2AQL5_9PEZI|nr:uncharacterized protein PV09_00750 [Verruconis gallopava]KIW08820.1 hypothetical protein PV09_00750 [Verruconis gallopava]